MQTEQNTQALSPSSWSSIQYDSCSAGFLFQQLQHTLPRFLQRFLALLLLSLPLSISLLGWSHSCKSFSGAMALKLWLASESPGEVGKKTKSQTLFYLSDPQFSSVQLLSRVRLFVTPWIAARQASLSITSSQSLPKHLSIESMIPSSHLILCRPLLLLPPVPPSIRVFSNESTLCMRWPKFWSFSFSISPSNEHPGLISFRMDWLGLPAVQGTLKSFLQHHNSKASILQRSAFFTVQFSHPYLCNLISSSGDSDTHPVP